MTTTPPPIAEPAPLVSRDNEHLRLLAIGNFVMSGLAFAGLGFLGLHFTIMRLVFTSPEFLKNSKGQPLPPEILNIFWWFYAIFGLVITAAGIANLLSGLFLRRRKNRTVSLVIAGMNCLQMPFGTLLGVFTFLVLLRESVIAQYRQPSA